MTGLSARFEHTRINRPWGRWGLRFTGISYIALIILLPLAVLVKEALNAGPAIFWAEISHPLAIYALRITLTSALLTTIINAMLGTITAYVLVRYHFPGRHIFNSIIDLPFAIPTLVTG